MGRNSKKNKGRKSAPEQGLKGAASLAAASAYVATPPPRPARTAKHKIRKFPEQPRATPSTPANDNQKGMDMKEQEAVTLKRGAVPTGPSATGTTESLSTSTASLTEPAYAAGSSRDEGTAPSKILNDPCDTSSASGSETDTGNQNDRCFVPARDGAEMLGIEQTETEPAQEMYVELQCPEAEIIAQKTDINEHSSGMVSQPIAREFLTTLSCLEDKPVIDALDNSQGKSSRNQTDHNKIDFENEERRQSYSIQDASLPKHGNVPRADLTAETSNQVCDKNSSDRPEEDSLLLDDKRNEAEDVLITSCIASNDLKQKTDEEQEIQIIEEILKKDRQQDEGQRTSQDNTPNPDEEPKGISNASASLTLSSAPVHEEVPETLATDGDSQKEKVHEESSPVAEKETRDETLRQLERVTDFEEHAEPSTIGRLEKAEPKMPEEAVDRAKYEEIHDASAIAPPDQKRQTGSLEHAMEKPHNEQSHEEPWKEEVIEIGDERECQEIQVNTELREEGNDQTTQEMGTTARGGMRENLNKSPDLIEIDCVGEKQEPAARNEKEKPESKDEIEVQMETKMQEYEIHLVTICEGHQKHEDESSFEPNQHELEQPLENSIPGDPTVELLASMHEEFLDDKDSSDFSNQEQLVNEILLISATGIGKDTEELEGIPTTKSPEDETDQEDTRYQQKQLTNSGEDGIEHTKPKGGHGTFQNNKDKSTELQAEFNQGYMCQEIDENEQKSPTVGEPHFQLMAIQDDQIRSDPVCTECKIEPLQVSQMEDPKPGGFIEPQKSEDKDTEADELIGSSLSELLITDSLETTLDNLKLGEGWVSLSYAEKGRNQPDKAEPMLSVNEEQGPNSAESESKFFGLQESEKRLLSCDKWDCKDSVVIHLKDSTKEGQDEHVSKSPPNEQLITDFVERAFETLKMDASSELKLDELEEPEAQAACPPRESKGAVATEPDKIIGYQDDEVIEFSPHKPLLADFSRKELERFGAIEKLTDQMNSDFDKHAVPSEATDLMLAKPEKRDTKAACDNKVCQGDELLQPKDGSNKGSGHEVSNCSLYEQLFTDSVLKDLEGPDLTDIQIDSVTNKLMLDELEEPEPIPAVFVEIKYEESTALNPQDEIMKRKNTLPDEQSITNSAAKDMEEPELSERHLGYTSSVQEEQAPQLTTSELMILDLAQKDGEVFVCKRRDDFVLETRNCRESATLLPDETEESQAYKTINSLANEHNITNSLKEDFEVETEGEEQVESEPNVNEEAQDTKECQEAVVIQPEETKEYNDRNVTKSTLPETLLTSCLEVDEIHEDRISCPSEDQAPPSRELNLSEMTECQEVTIHPASDCSPHETLVKDSEAIDLKNLNLDEIQVDHTSSACEKETLFIHESTLLQLERPEPEIVYKENVCQHVSENHPNFDATEDQDDEVKTSRPEQLLIDHTGKDTESLHITDAHIDFTSLVCEDRPSQLATAHLKHHELETPEAYVEQMENQEAIAASPKYEATECKDDEAFEFSPNKQLKVKFTEKDEERLGIDETQLDNTSPVCKEQAPQPETSKLVLDPLKEQEPSTGCHETKSPETIALHSKDETTENQAEQDSHSTPAEQIAAVSEKKDVQRFELLEARLDQTSYAVQKEQAPQLAASNLKFSELADSENELIAYKETEPKEVATLCPSEIQEDQGSQLSNSFPNENHISPSPKEDLERIMGEANIDPTNSMCEEEVPLSSATMTTKLTKLEQLDSEGACHERDYQEAVAHHQHDTEACQDGIANESSPRKQLLGDSVEECMEMLELAALPGIRVSSLLTELAVISATSDLNLSGQEKQEHNIILEKEESQELAVRSAISELNLGEQEKQEQNIILEKEESQEVATLPKDEPRDGEHRELSNFFPNDQLITHSVRIETENLEKAQAQVNHTGCGCEEQPRLSLAGESKLLHLIELENEVAGLDEKKSQLAMANQRKVEPQEKEANDWSSAKQFTTDSTGRSMESLEVGDSKADCASSVYDEQAPQSLTTNLENVETQKPETDVDERECQDHVSLGPKDEIAEYKGYSNNNLSLNELLTTNSMEEGLTKLAVAEARIDHTNILIEEQDLQSLVIDLMPEPSIVVLDEQKQIEVIAFHPKDEPIECLSDQIDHSFPDKQTIIISGGRDLNGCELREANIGCTSSVQGKQAQQFVESKLKIHGLAEGEVTLREERKCKETETFCADNMKEARANMHLITVSVEKDLEGQEEDEGHVEHFVGHEQQDIGVTGKGRAAQVTITLDPNNNPQEGQCDPVGNFFPDKQFITDSTGKEMQKLEECETQVHHHLSPVCEEQAAQSAQITPKLLQTEEKETDADEKAGQEVAAHYPEDNKRKSKHDKESDSSENEQTLTNLAENEPKRFVVDEAQVNHIDAMIEKGVPRYVVTDLVEKLTTSVCEESHKPEPSSIVCGETKHQEAVTLAPKDKTQGEAGQALSDFSPDDQTIIDSGGKDLEAFELPEARLDWTTSENEQPSPQFSASESQLHEPAQTEEVVACNENEPPSQFTPSTLKALETVKTKADVDETEGQEAAAFCAKDEPAEGETDNTNDSYTDEQLITDSVEKDLEKLVVGEARIDYTCFINKDEALQSVASDLMPGPSTSVCDELESSKSIIFESNEPEEIAPSIIKCDEEAISLTPNIASVEDQATEVSHSSPYEKIDLLASVRRSLEKFELHEAQVECSSSVDKQQTHPFAALDLKLHEMAEPEEEIIICHERECKEIITLRKEEATEGEIDEASNLTPDENLIIESVRKDLEGLEVDEKLLDCVSPPCVEKAPLSPVMKVKLAEAEELDVEAVYEKRACQDAITFYPQDETSNGETSYSFPGEQLNTNSAGTDSGCSEVAEAQVDPIRSEYEEERLVCEKQLPQFAPLTMKRLEAEKPETDLDERECKEAVAPCPKSETVEGKGDNASDSSHDQLVMISAEKGLHSLAMGEARIDHTCCIAQDQALQYVASNLVPEPSSVVSDELEEPEQSIMCNEANHQEGLALALAPKDHNIEGQAEQVSQSSLHEQSQQTIINSEAKFAASEIGLHELVNPEDVLACQERESKETRTFHPDETKEGQRNEASESLTNQDVITESVENILKKLLEVAKPREDLNSSGCEDPEAPSEEIQPVCLPLEEPEEEFIACDEKNSQNSLAFHPKIDSNAAQHDKARGSSAFEQLIITESLEKDMERLEVGDAKVESTSPVCDKQSTSSTPKTLDMEKPEADVDECECQDAAAVYPTDESEEIKNDNINDSFINEQLITKPVEKDLEKLAVGEAPVDHTCFRIEEQGPQSVAGDLMPVPSTGVCHELKEPETRISVCDETKHQEVIEINSENESVEPHAAQVSHSSQCEPISIFPGERDLKTLELLEAQMDFTGFGYEEEAPEFAASMKFHEMAEPEKEMNSCEENERRENITLQRQYDTKEGENNATINALPDEKLITASAEKNLEGPDVDGEQGDDISSPCAEQAPSYTASELKLPEEKPVAEAMDEENACQEDNALRSKNEPKEGECDLLSSFSPAKQLTTDNAGTELGKVEAGEAQADHNRSGCEEQATLSVTREWKFRQMEEPEEIPIESDEKGVQKTAELQPKGGTQGFHRDKMIDSFPSERLIITDFTKVQVDSTQADQRSPACEKQAQESAPWTVKISETEKPEIDLNNSECQEAVVLRSKDKMQEDEVEHVSKTCQSEQLITNSLEEDLDKLAIGEAQTDQAHFITDEPPLQSMESDLVTEGNTIVCDEPGWPELSIACDETQHQEGIGLATKDQNVEDRAEEVSHSSSCEHIIDSGEKDSKILELHEAQLDCTSSEHQEQEPQFAASEVRLHKLADTDDVIATEERECEETLTIHPHETKEGQDNATKNTPPNENFITHSVKKEFGGLDVDEEQVDHINSLHNEHAPLSSASELKLVEPEEQEAKPTCEQQEYQGDITLEPKDEPKEDPCHLVSDFSVDEQLTDSVRADLESLEVAVAMVDSKCEDKSPPLVAIESHLFQLQEPEEEALLFDDKFGQNTMALHPKGESEEGQSDEVSHFSESEQLMNTDSAGKDIGKFELGKERTDNINPICEESASSILKALEMEKPKPDVDEREYQEKAAICSKHQMGEDKGDSISNSSPSEWIMTNPVEKDLTTLATGEAQVDLTFTGQCQALQSVKQDLMSELGTVVHGELEESSIFLCDEPEHKEVIAPAPKDESIEGQAEQVSDCSTDKRGITTSGQKDFERFELQDTNLDCTKTVYAEQAPQFAERQLKVDEPAEQEEELIACDERKCQKTMTPVAQETEKGLVDEISGTSSNENCIEESAEEDFKGIDVGEEQVHHISWCDEQAPLSATSDLKLVKPEEQEVEDVCQNGAYQEAIAIRSKNENKESQSDPVNDCSTEEQLITDSVRRDSENVKVAKAKEDCINLGHDEQEPLSVANESKPIQLEDSKEEFTAHNEKECKEPAMPHLQREAKEQDDEARDSLRSKQLVTEATEKDMEKHEASAAQVYHTSSVSEEQARTLVPNTLKHIEMKNPEPVIDERECPEATAFYLKDEAEEAKGDNVDESSRDQVITDSAENYIERLAVDGTSSVSEERALQSLTTDLMPERSSVVCDEREGSEPSIAVFDERNGQDHPTNKVIQGQVEQGADFSPDNQNVERFELLEAQLDCTDTADKEEQMSLLAASTLRLCELAKRAEVIPFEEMDCNEAEMLRSDETQERQGDEAITTMPNEHLGTDFVEKEEEGLNVGKVLVDHVTCTRDEEATPSAASETKFVELEGIEPEVLTENSSVFEKQAPASVVNRSEIVQPEKLGAEVVGCDDQECHPLKLKILALEKSEADVDEKDSQKTVLIHLEDEAQEGKGNNVTDPSPLDQLIAKSEEKGQERFEVCEGLASEPVASCAPVLNKMEASEPSTVACSERKYQEDLEMSCKMENTEGQIEKVSRSTPDEQIITDSVEEDSKKLDVGDAQENHASSFSQEQLQWSVATDLKLNGLEEPRAELHLFEEPAPHGDTRMKQQAYTDSHMSVS